MRWIQVKSKEELEKGGRSLSSYDITHAMYSLLGKIILIRSEYYEDNLYGRIAGKTERYTIYEAMVHGYVSDYQEEFQKF